MARTLEYSGWSLQICNLVQRSRFATPVEGEKMTDEWYERTLGDKHYSLTLGVTSSSPEYLINSSRFDWWSVPESDQEIFVDLLDIYDQKGLAYVLCSLHEGDTFGLGHHFQCSQDGGYNYRGVKLTVNSGVYLKVKRRFLEDTFPYQDRKLQILHGQLVSLYIEIGLKSWLVEPKTSSV